MGWEGLLDVVSELGCRFLFSQGYHHESVLYFYPCSTFCIVTEAFACGNPLRGIALPAKISRTDMSSLHAVYGYNSRYTVGRWNQ